MQEIVDVCPPLESESLGHTGRRRRRSRPLSGSHRVTSRQQPSAECEDTASVSAVTRRVLSDAIRVAWQEQGRRHKLVGRLHERRTAAASSECAPSRRSDAKVCTPCLLRLHNALGAEIRIMRVDVQSVPPARARSVPSCEEEVRHAHSLHLYRQIRTRESRSHGIPGRPAYRRARLQVGRSTTRRLSVRTPDVIYVHYNHNPSFCKHRPALRDDASYQDQARFPSPTRFYYSDHPSDSE